MEESSTYRALDNNGLNRRLMENAIRQAVNIYSNNEISL